MLRHAPNRADIAMTGHILPDTQNAPRGIALKVFGVDGEKMKEGNPEKGGWHDIFMNNAPILEVSNAVTIRPRR
jgi:hypothetical protein